jgi:S1-C subfamily serine protease
MTWSLSSSLRRRALIPCLSLLLLVVSLVPVGGNGAVVAAQTSTLPETVLQSSVRLQLVIEVTPTGRRAEPVLCTYPQGGVLEYGNGSGTIISPDGFILTNHHVTAAIQDEIPAEIVEFCAEQAGDEDSDVELTLLAWTPNERGAPSDAYRIEIIEESSRVDDMAIVQITEEVDGSRVNTRRNPFPFVQFGDSDLLREPEKITMIGYPGNAGINRRVSEGIFSGWGDNGSGVDWIYTDAVGSGGISGGTAVNTEGLFIGIPSAGTSDDCRPGDTNRDGVVDEDDGCIGTGGNYTILIPGNLAREFAEDATGLEFDVADQATPDETPEPTATDEPVDPTAPLIENIEFIGMDDEGNVIDDMTDLRRLESCFDSTIPGGSLLEVTWFLNGEPYFVTELEWEDAYNPNGCVSIFLTEEATIPFLEPGTYSAEIEVNGETFTSGEVEVFRSESAPSTNVESVSLRGRTTDSESVTARDSVLTGEFESLTATISFVDMEPGLAWQADLTFEGELVMSTNPEVWTGEASGSESIRLLPTDETFEPGAYEITVTVNGEPVFTQTFSIEE